MSKSYKHFKIGKKYYWRKSNNKRIERVIYQGRSWDSETKSWIYKFDGLEFSQSYVINNISNINFWQL